MFKAKQAGRNRVRVARSMAGLQKQERYFYHRPGVV
jgi:hypothetical protein